MKTSFSRTTLHLYKWKKQCNNIKDMCIKIFFEISAHQMRKFSKKRSRKIQFCPFFPNYLIPEPNKCVFPKFHFFSYFRTLKQQQQHSVYVAYPLEISLKLNSHHESKSELFSLDFILSTLSSSVTNNLLLHNDLKTK